MSFKQNLGFPGGTSGKEPTYQCRRYKRHGFDPWVRKVPWRREWLPTPILLPGESHGQKSLVGYSPRGHKESDTTEPLSMHSPYVQLNWFAIHLGLTQYCTLTLVQYKINTFFLKQCFEVEKHFIGRSEEAEVLSPCIWHGQ